MGGPSPYTDLAVELRGNRRAAIPGVRVEEERKGSIVVTRVAVLDAEGERQLGKVPGNYITIECRGLAQHDRQLQERVGGILVDELDQLLRGISRQQVLVVGLGNWRATPDALGPRVVENLLVTRHLREYVPPELEGRLRSVAAVAPGVLGITGIETGEIIKGIVERTQPDVVLCIDALAARSAERIGTTVQLADTGIYPGSGIGNARPAINREALGVPVIAIGVPTVVHAMTIAQDTVDLLIAQLKDRSRFFDLLAEFGAEEKRRLIQEVLSPTVGDLVVTPKEVDDIISEMARVIAGALNTVLHPGISKDDLCRYLG